MTPIEALRDIMGTLRHHADVRGVTTDVYLAMQRCDTVLREIAESEAAAGKQEHPGYGGLTIKELTQRVGLGLAPKQEPHGKPCLWHERGRRVAECPLENETDDLVPICPAQPCRILPLEGE